MSATEPIRNKTELNALARYFLEKQEYRNYTLVIMGASTALRISDLLKLCWDDAYDPNTATIKDHLSLTEQKTGKQKTLALTPAAKNALMLLYKHQHGKYIFSNGRKKEAPISRVQAWRILHSAVKALGIKGHISCHSLRKTWAYHAWVDAQVSPVLIMDALNHSSYAVTKRYIGIMQDEIDSAYLSLNLFTP